MQRKNNNQEPSFATLQPHESFSVPRGGGGRGRGPRKRRERNRFRSFQQESDGSSEEPFFDRFFVLNFPRLDIDGDLNVIAADKEIH